MCIGHSRLCVCLSLTAFPHYCMDPDMKWRNGRGCPLVVHYWADLQSVHGFCCYDNIALNVKCQQVLTVLTLCLVEFCDQCLAKFNDTLCLKNISHLFIVCNFVES